MVMSPDEKAAQRQLDRADDERRRHLDFPVLVGRVSEAVPDEQCHGAVECDPALAPCEGENEERAREVVRRGPGSRLRGFVPVDLGRRIGVRDDR